jgi:hypothetical protein
MPLGQTQMTGPRTCSATFSPTAEVSAVPVKPPPPAVARGRAGAAPPSPVAAGTDAALPAPNPPPPPSRSPGQGQVVDRTLDKTPPVVAPPTAEEFAKGQIQQLLKDYCAAEEALDPNGVQKLFPSVNLNALKVQLNQSKYRSVQCRFGDALVYQSLDAPAGKAKIQVPLKVVYEHTILTEKPIVNELMTTLTLLRTASRTQWQIDKAEFKPLVKDPPK